MKNPFEYFVSRRFNDEPDIPGSFVPEGYGWMGKISPASPSGNYRVIEYPNRSFNRYGLEAEVNGIWVVVKVYDDGYDDEGQLEAGRWRPLSDICSWSVGSLNTLVCKLKGENEPVRVVEGL